MEDLDVSHLRDVAAEEAVLARLTFGADAVRAAVDVDLLVPDFTSAARSAIFAAAVELEALCAPVDLVSLHDALRRRGDAERCGGPLELARLADLAPSGADVVHYAGIVRRLARRRALVQAALRLARRAADLTTPDDALTLDAAPDGGDGGTDGANGA